MNDIKQKNKRTPYNKLIMFTEKIILLIISLTLFYFALLGWITTKLPTTSVIVAAVFGAISIWVLLKIK